MPERFDPHHEKDDDDSDKKSGKSSERRPWEKPSESDSRPRWQETPKMQPHVPESEEVRRYAAERRAHLVTEWSLDDKRKEKDTEKADSRELSHDEPPAAPTESATPYREQTEHAVHEAAPEDTAPENRPEPSAAETDAAREAAHEQLEAHEPIPDPVADYLEKIVQDGDPVEAEQETIREHGLDEMQVEADLLVWELEDLLERAAERAADRDLSDEEMLELAHEMTADIEAREADLVGSETPGSPDVPLITRPGRATPNVLASRHAYRPPNAGNTSRAAGMPPIVPPFGGGGGGGGGPNMLGAAGALNPNIQAAWYGAKTAEQILVRQEVRRNPIFFKLLLAYYIGRHFGRKRGLREKEAEMRPDLERQTKINKQQDFEIMVGKKRIDSLQRMKDIQEKELHEQKRRQRHIQSGERPSVPSRVHVERPPIESHGQGPAPNRPGREGRPIAPPVHPDESRPERAPEFDAGAVRPPEKVAERELSAQPHHRPERAIRPPLTPLIHTTAEQVPPPEVREESAVSPLASEPAGTFADTSQPETSAIEQSQAAERFSVPPVAEMSSAAESSLYVPPALFERETESAEPFAPADRSAEIARPEREALSSSRPEVPSYAPGLELPSASAVSERLTPSISEESHGSTLDVAPRPEAFDAAALATMNLPELLTAAKEMSVGNENLGQIFRENRIDAAGLRRVATEYARGGNPEQILDLERQLKEVSRDSPEFMRSGAAGSSDSGMSGGGAGLFTQASTKTSDHILSAYDQEQYPSDTPQHLLPAYDQETLAKKQRRVVVVAAALIGLGMGIVLGLVLL